jgi:integrase
MVGMKLARARKVQLTTLDATQSATLLAAIKHTALYLPSLLALYTGMRRGEILALRWRDVDLAAAQLTVFRSLEQTKKGGLRFKEPKRESSRRTIAIPALAVDELRRHKREQGEQRMRLGLGAFDDESLVVCRHDSEPMRPRTMTIEFGRLVRRVAGIPRVRFHDLRHTHVTMMLQLGVNPKVVSERAGHSTVAFTLQVYGGVQPGMQEEAAAKIDAAFRRASAGANDT